MRGAGSQVNALVMELARCDDASAALCRATLPALGQVPPAALHRVTSTSFCGSALTRSRSDFAEPCTGAALPSASTYSACICCGAG